MKDTSAALSKTTPPVATSAGPKNAKGTTKSDCDPRGKDTLNIKDTSAGRMLKGQKLVHQQSTAATSKSFMPVETTIRPEHAQITTKSDCEAQGKDSMQMKDSSAAPSKTTPPVATSARPKNARGTIKSDCDPRGKDTLRIKDTGAGRMLKAQKHEHQQSTAATSKSISPIATGAMPKHAKDTSKSDCEAQGKDSMDVKDTSAAPSKTTPPVATSAGPKNAKGTIKSDCGPRGKDTLNIKDTSAGRMLNCQKHGSKQSTSAASAPGPPDDTSARPKNSKDAPENESEVSEKENLKKNTHMVKPSTSTSGVKPSKGRGIYCELRSFTSPFL